MQWRSSKAVRHSTSSLAAQVVNALASLFQAAYLARHLRVVGYSEYSLVFSFNILFLAFTDLGLSQIAVREIVQYPDKVRSILSTVFSMRLFLGFAGWLACVVASAWTGYSSAVVGGIWIYSLVLLVSPLGTVSILNQIQFRGDLALLASTGSRVLLLAGTVAVVRLGMGLNALFAVAVGASVAEYVVNAFLVGGWRYLKPCWDMATGKSLAQEALPLGLASLLATVINRFDVVLLSKMSGMQAVGIYSAPFRVAYFLTFIPQAAMASFYPLVSEYRQAQPDRVREVYQHTVELMAFLALPMAVGGTLLAPRVIPLIFGETFQASVRVFQVLVWQVAIVFVAIVPGTLLIAHGLQRVNLGLQAITVCISLLLNLLLIPSLGALAPALATLAAHVFLGVTTLVVAQSRLALGLRWKNLGRQCLNAGLFATVLYLLRSENLFLVAALAGVIYLSLARVPWPVPATGGERSPRW